MLPAKLQFLIVMIASAINDGLRRKLDYVEEERRILREQLDAATGGKKLSFTVRQRRRLAEAGKLLTSQERLADIGCWLLAHLSRSYAVSRKTFLLP
jgi:hypothetical protein